MGPPPANLTTAGRANARGIPVFYGSEIPQVAVAEVRPWVGATVRYAGWRPLYDLNVVDFTAHVGAQSAWAQFYQDVSAALATPVSPDASEMEYIPTQYLMEVLKNAGYQGAFYQSAQVSGERNFVVFRPCLMQMVTTPSEVTVTGITHQCQPPVP